MKIRIIVFGEKWECTYTQVFIHYLQSTFVMNLIPSSIKLEFEISDTDFKHNSLGIVEQLSHFYPYGAIM